MKTDTEDRMRLLMEVAEDEIERLESRLKSRLEDLQRDLRTATRALEEGRVPNKHGVVQAAGSSIDMMVAELDAKKENLRFLRGLVRADRVDTDKKTEKKYDENGSRLTDCCGSYSTYDCEGNLECKSCFGRVAIGEGDGSERKD